CGEMGGWGRWGHPRSTRGHRGTPPRQEGPQVGQYLPHIFSRGLAGGAACVSPPQFGDGRGRGDPRGQVTPRGSGDPWRGLKRREMGP
ncbi:unnamed protein product, partial [Bubo scandiacus]